MLYAQASEVVATYPTWMFMLLGFGGVGITLFILGLVIILRFAQAGRQLQHAERMKAIEAGFPLEDTVAMKASEKYMHNAFWISFWLGLGVPMVAFGAASSAERVITGNLGLGIAVWTGAALASIAGVVSAVVLMIFSRTKQADDASSIAVKPRL